MNVDRAVGHECAFPPSPVEQLLPGKDTSGRAREQFQQSKFLGGERNFLFVVNNPEFIRINDDRAITKNGRRSRRRSGPFFSPLNRLDPSYQLTRAERFYHVIIPPDFEADNAVDLVAAGSEEN